MNTIQIYKTLMSEKAVQDMNFLGVFPKDKIPYKNLQFPSCAVVNTKPHTDKGEHWVCFVKNRDKTGIYFDSYGYPPYNLPEIGDALQDCVEWSFNDIALQTPFSTVCGEYCIFVLSHLAKGYTMEHIIYLLNDSGDTYSNDALIFNYIKQKYSDVINTKDLKIVDLPFIFQQTQSVKKHGKRLLKKPKKAKHQVYSNKKKYLSKHL